MALVHRVGVLCCLAAISLAADITQPVQPLEVDVHLDARSPFVARWRRSWGSGHAALTLREDWRAQLKSAVEELGLEGVRYHGLFDDDMGPVVTAPGVYNFTLVDSTWDFFVQLGVKPIVELSFMPCVLANCSWHGYNPGHPKCKQLTFKYQGGSLTEVHWSLVVAVQTLTHPPPREGSS